MQKHFSPSITQLNILVLCQIPHDFYSILSNIKKITKDFSKTSFDKDFNELRKLKKIVFITEVGKYYTHVPKPPVQIVNQLCFDF